MGDGDPGHVAEREPSEMKSGQTQWDYYRMKRHSGISFLEGIWGFVGDIGVRRVHRSARSAGCWLFVGANRWNANVGCQLGTGNDNPAPVVAIL